tara:strand:+ start:784 stop:2205 length:1422 start_codon:yes stop_codon:yes gene_type:complete
MVEVSGPPFDRYPPMVDGTRETFINGKRISNVFDIKRQIFERENKNFRSLEFYRKTSRELLNIFSDGQIIGADNEIQDVQCVYANYERAIAMLFKNRNLTLPMMTLAISDTVEDTERRKPNTNIEFWTIQDKKTGRHTRVASLSPKAVKVSYQLHLWTRYVEDMNQLLEYVMAKFRPYLRVGTDFITNAPAFITATSDNSTLSVPDREDRVIKKTVTFEIETWMPTRQYMIQSNGDIREMRYDVELETDPPFTGSGTPPPSLFPTLENESPDGTACDTLVHFENPQVSPSDVRFLKPPPRRINKGLEMYFDFTADIYAECETVECETTCTTSTPGPVPYKDFVGTQGILPNDFENSLREWMERNNNTSPSLQDLIDDNFVNNTGVKTPENAYGSFGPVTDFLDYDTGTPFNSRDGNYLRPKGNDSISLNDYLAGGGSMEGWNLLFGKIKPCTCMRVVITPIAQTAVLYPPTST